MLCLVLSFLCGTSVRGAQPDKEIDRLAKAYRAARTEFERRAVCLDAIDAGVIAEGRSVAVVDAIFGTNDAGKLPRGSELEAGVVDFHLSRRRPATRLLPPTSAGILRSSIGKTKIRFQKAEASGQEFGRGIGS